jgi:arylformamidase
LYSNDPRSPRTSPHLFVGSVRCVEEPAPSIEEYNCDGSVHRRLLGGGTVILELLDLSAVPEGDYVMVALPMRLRGADGSPVRAILRDREE